MDLVLVVAALICLAMGAAVVFLFRKLLAGAKTLPVSADWINDLSVMRYRPMERLLDEEDYRFLASQSGCDRRMLRRIRSERRKLFRGYLACLNQDFKRVCGALRLLMMYSAQDRRDLATILYKQQARFALGMLAVQWRLALHACGLGTVEVHGLVSAMESMRLELRQIVPIETAAAA